MRAGLRNPVLVSVKDKEGSTLNNCPSSLDNYYAIVPDVSQKLALLLSYVKKVEKGIVFFSTCACVEYFSTCLERLHKEGEVFSIHGSKKGNKRHKVFEAFKKAKKGLLLCTDVMARGIIEINFVCSSPYLGQILDKWNPEKYQQFEKH